MSEAEYERDLEARAEFAIASGNPDPSSPDNPSERWVIYKRTGEWDDVIQGPDHDEIVVCPVSELEVALRERDEESESHAETIKHAEALHDNLRAEVADLKRRLEEKDEPQ